VARKKGVRTYTLIMGKKRPNADIILRKSEEELIEIFLKYGWTMRTEGENIVLLSPDGDSEWVFHPDGFVSHYYRHSDGHMHGNCDGPWRFRSRLRALAFALAEEEVDFRPADELGMEWNSCAEAGD